MNSELTVDIASMAYPSLPDSNQTIGEISFQAQEGNFISLLGPSGAGKTTLLRIIAGLENRYVGQVRLGDQRISKPSRDIQIVFQDHRLLPWRTVSENIQFALPKAEQSNVLTTQWVEKVRLSGKEDAWPKNLSGGQEGRVAFARAFVDPPKVLLLDEPFRNLDILSKLDLQTVLLKAIAEQPMIVIMVSHSVDDALLFSDMIFLVSDSPMIIRKQIPLPNKRPRERTDKWFRELSEEITADLLQPRAASPASIQQG